MNIVTGDGPGAGAALVAHPDVDKIAFTGSAEVGKPIMRNAAERLKQISLELGGKSPNIFFADADFEAAVDGALFGVFVNQGEVCSAGSRMLVQQDDLPASSSRRWRPRPRRITGRARRWTATPRWVRSSAREQRDRVARVPGDRQEGSEAGASAAARPSSCAERGWFVEPTIFYDVDNSARIAQEEIFGPVAGVIPFEDEAEAIEIANDTHYGLAAAVWTRDIFRALRVVKALEAGIVWVNHMQPTYVEAPWGGYKRVRLRPRAGPVGRRGVSRDQAGQHQPRREADRLVLTWASRWPSRALRPWWAARRSTGRARVGRRHQPIHRRADRRGGGRDRGGSRGGDPRRAGGLSTLRALSRHARREVLARAADRIRGARRARRQITAACGKPISQALAEVDRAALTFSFAADEARRLRRRGRAA